MSVFEVVEGYDLLQTELKSNSSLLTFFIFLGKTYYFHFFPIFDCSQTLLIYCALFSNYAKLLISCMKIFRNYILETNKECEIHFVKVNLNQYMLINCDPSAS